MMRISILAALGALLAISPARADTLCTALADAATGTILRQDGKGCAQRVTPASTFKIPIALMGYDSGILTDAHAPSWPFKQGYPDWLPAWRSDTDPTSWMKNSVVWYSQQITLKLGAERFKRYVDGFGYGNRDVSGDRGKDNGKDNGLTDSWLSSSLAISPLEQVAFLGRLLRGKLPVSAQAVEMTGRILRVESPANGWQVYGKTGMGFPRKADGSNDRNRPYGWFVGWAIKDGRTLVFARLDQDASRQDTPTSWRARDGFLAALPGMLEGL